MLWDCLEIANVEDLPEETSWRTLRHMKPAGSQSCDDTDQPWFGNTVNVSLTCLRKSLIHMMSRKILDSKELMPIVRYAVPFVGMPSLKLHAPSNFRKCIPTIQTSWITPHHFILRELISAIISPPVTPNNFWGFSKRNSQENYTTLSCPY